MGVLAPHPRPQAAAVYPGLPAADESAVLAGGHSDVREKYRAAARDSPSAVGRDFRWAGAVQLVEQADEPPERQGQQRLAAPQRVVCREPQMLLVEVPWLRPVQQQPRGEWVSAGPQVPQASPRQGDLLALGPVPWEPLSAAQERPSEQVSHERQAPLVLPRARQVHQGQSASQQPESPGELAEQAPVRLAWYAPPSRRPPSLLSPLWQQLLPELRLLQPLGFSFVPSPQRLRESN